MLDGFNTWAISQPYLSVMAWVLCLLAINAMIRIAMFFYDREIVGNLVFTAISMSSVVVSGALFVRLPEVGQADGLVYYQYIARLLSYGVAVGSAITGWAVTFKMIKIELKTEERKKEEINDGNKPS
jgi:hypothetical protein